jgi:hypothetical protein
MGYYYNLSDVENELTTNTFSLCWTHYNCKDYPITHMIANIPEWVDYMIDNDLDFPDDDDTNSI